MLWPSRSRHGKGDVRFSVLFRLSESSCPMRTSALGMAAVNSDAFPGLDELKSQLNCVILLTLSEGG